MHTPNILVNVSACRGRERQLKGEHRGKGREEVLPFRRREVRPHVTCYEKALLTFKFYSARMTRLLQIFVFAHLWNTRRTQSALICYKTARRFLSGKGLWWKFTVGLSRVYVHTPRPRFLRRILFLAIFFPYRFYRRTIHGISEDYFVQRATVAREYANGSRERTYLFTNLHYTNEWKNIIRVRRYIRIFSGECIIRNKLINLLTKRDF